MVASEVAADLVVETDPELVAAVVQQLVRACECLSTDLSIRLTLQADARGCSVRVAAPAIADLTPRVARIGLVRPGETAAHDELAEMASLLVPAAALDSLGARLGTDNAHAGELEIRLPLAGVPALA